MTTATTVRTKRQMHRKLMVQIFVCNIQHTKIIRPQLECLYFWGGGGAQHKVEVDENDVVSGGGIAEAWDVDGGKTGAYIGARVIYALSSADYQVDELISTTTTYLNDTLLCNRNRGRECLSQKSRHDEECELHIRRLVYCTSCCSYTPRRGAVPGRKYQPIVVTLVEQKEPCTIINLSFALTCMFVSSCSPLFSKVQSGMGYIIGVGHRCRSA